MLKPRTGEAVLEDVEGKMEEWWQQSGQDVRKFVQGNKLCKGKGKLI